LFDVVDRLREDTEACIDEAKGEGATQQVALLNKALEQGANASELSKINSSTRGNRPQANFVPAIDNSRKAARASTTLHPHRQVIEDLVLSELQTSKASPPQTFLKLSDVECDFIETREKLDEMIAHLDGVCEIAIDLEAHSLRSFQGFTCLLQISSRTRDFLVDALALRPYLRSLNRVTTNPSILKVLHGCDSDVLWLQRDFNVYLVNVFDTGQAARVLAYPSFGLAYLLQTFANVTAQKQFQMADWRQRPIPHALLKYAREDTHYLLGIYDRVKNELIESSSSTSRVKVGELQGTSIFVDVPSLLHQVINRSNEITLKVYQVEKFRPFAYRRLLGKLSGSDSLAVSHLNDPEGREGEIHPAVDPSLSPRSRVFAALFDWRDAIAREEDESTHFVLPNQLLNRIADVIPATVEALVRCCSPPPSCVRARLFELVSIITAARDCKVSGPLAVSIADTNADTTTSQPLQSFSSKQPKGTELVLESYKVDPRLSGIHSTHLNKVPSSSSSLHVHSDSSLSVGSDFDSFGLKIPANGWLKVPIVSFNSTSSSLKMSEALLSQDLSAFTLKDLHKDLSL
jgi:exosome complex exonuclease RRP6